MKFTNIDFKYVIVSLSREKGKKNILQKLLETENGKFNKREIGRYSKIAREFPEEHLIQSERPRP